MVGGRERERERERERMEETESLYKNKEQNEVKA